MRLLAPGLAQPLHTHALFRLSKIFLVKELHIHRILDIGTRLLTAQYCISRIAPFRRVILWENLTHEVGKRTDENVYGYANYHKLNDHNSSASWADKKL